MPKEKFCLLVAAPFASLPSDAREVCVFDYLGRLDPALVSNAIDFATRMGLGIFSSKEMPIHIEGVQNHPEL
jgi:hypothetical protein